MLLVQNSADAGEAGVEEIAAAVGTYKGVGSAPARSSDAQVSTLPQQKWSTRMGF